MRDVKLDRIEREHCTNTFRLVFSGVYYKVAEALEYNKNYIVAAAESLRPKKVYYAINIPAKDFIEFYKYGNFEFIYKMLPFEIDERVFIEALMNYDRRF